MRDAKRDLWGLGLALLSISSVLVVVAGVLLVRYGLWVMVH